MVQCLSHRVELAFKDAMKKAPLYSKVYSLMDELFKFYHKSAKQSAGLKSSFEALNITPCTPTRVGGTRWLGHTLTALNNIWKGYTAIVKHLSQVSVTTGQSATQPKALYLLKLLRSNDVITFAHFLTDVVAVLAQLSKALQKRETCLYEVHQQLLATISNIKKFQTRPGPELRKVQRPDGSFAGESLTGDTTQHSAQMPKLLTALVETLDRRFSDIDEGVLCATKLADMNAWPASLEDSTNG
ncbi:uncharacterized protein [Ptychodera flava]|uniref:uncharacterized protein n=1 Tax=Ptychodera flava TaxID=63121 RepID=UPI00396A9F49